MSVYHKRTWIDWVVLGVVVAIALVIVALSFHNTSLLARELGINPYLAAGLVEILFASLLFLRGRQRATQRNVPTFLSVGYFASLAFVTGINMWGLAQANLIIGLIVGLAISGAMWLMESTLVWLWTSSHTPHRKSLREIKKQARREIKEEKAIQRIEWERWEARKPDLKLILDARKAEEKRKQVVAEGLPEYFLQEPEPIKEIVAEPVEIPQETAEIVPIRRQIGFHMEEPKKKPAPRFEPNLEARQQAIETAKELRKELGRMPKVSELKAKGLTDHYSKLALDMLKKGE